MNRRQEIRGGIQAGLSLDTSLCSTNGSVGVALPLRQQTDLSSREFSY